MITNLSLTKKSLGLSLVELMVAITISSVLLLGVSSVYLSTRHSNAVQDEFSRLQENGRFAIHTMTKDIRQAGYTACANLDTMTPAPVNNVSGGGGQDAAFNLTANTALTGHLGCSGSVCTPTTPTDLSATGISNGTQAITIRSSSSCQSILTGKLLVRNANLQLNNNACNFQANDILFITDCVAGDVFRATNVSAGGTTTIAHAAAGNVTPFLSKNYQQNARVMAWQRATYFIGPSVGDPTSRSLYVNRDIPGGGDLSTQLVENVEDLQIEYYVDSDFTLPDATPNVDGTLNGTQFLAALNAGTINWGNVLAVRIHLLMSTRNNVANLDNGFAATPFTFMGVQQISADRRYRKEFTTTINLRNRVL